MLFGGFGAPPPRRRPNSESKPAEQVKSSEQSKPAEISKVQPSTNVTNTVKPSTNTTTQPANNPTPQQIAQTVGKQTLPVNNVVSQLANTIKAPQADNNRGKSA